MSCDRIDWEPTCCTVWEEDVCCTDPATCADDATRMTCIDWEPVCCDDTHADYTDACVADSQDEANCMAYTVPECCLSCGAVDCVGGEVCPDSLRGLDDYACCYSDETQPGYDETYECAAYRSPLCDDVCDSEACSMTCDEGDAGKVAFYNVVLAALPIPEP